MPRSREETVTAVCVNPLSQAFSKQPTLALPSSSLPALVLLMSWVETAVLLHPLHKVEGQYLEDRRERWAQTFDYL